MCLITCVFRGFCGGEEIRVGFLPVPEAFRDTFKTDVSIVWDTAALIQDLR
jgi:hypothetical protein